MPLPTSAERIRLLELQVQTLEEKAKLLEASLAESVVLITRSDRTHNESNIRLAVIEKDLGRLESVHEVKDKVIGLQKDFERLETLLKQIDDRRWDLLKIVIGAGIGSVLTFVAAYLTKLTHLR